MSVESVFLGILFIIFCISIIKMCYPSLLKILSFRVFLLLSFYWAIGGFTITPILMNVANVVGFIIVWSWVVIMVLFIAKTRANYLVKKNKI